MNQIEIRSLIFVLDIEFEVLCKIQSGDTAESYEWNETEFSGELGGKVNSVYVVMKQCLCGLK